MPPLDGVDDWVVPKAIAPIASTADGGGEDDEERQKKAFLARNKAWTRPDAKDFTTKLDPDQEAKFQAWVKANKVPFDPGADADYDMRGYWKASQDPAAWKKLVQDGHIDAALTKIDPNDGKPHYPDWWKTPYHETFSNESQWADPAKAPRWNDKDQLVAPDGKIVFDDRAQNAPEAAPEVDDWIVPKAPDRTPPPVTNPASTDALNRITGAIVQGAKEGWGSAQSPEVAAANAAADRDLGAWAPVAHATNWLYDNAGRPLSAAFRGAQGGVAQAATELGAPELGRDLAAMPEAFMGSPEALRTPEPGAPPSAAGPRIEPRVTMPPRPGAPVAGEPLALAGPVEPSAAASVEAPQSGVPTAPAPFQTGATTTSEPSPTEHPTVTAPNIHGEVDDWITPEPTSERPAAPTPTVHHEVDDWILPESPKQTIETERLAAQHGVDPAGLTHDQFHDQLAEKASPGTVAAEHARIADQHAVAYEDAEKAAEDWIAYHGTPHDFDQFDVGKIGTGEGAQSFGHGLYFAENEGIANDYRNKLGHKALIDLAKDAYGQGDDPADAEERLFEQPMTPKQRATLDALKADGWLGFDYPHQAISAAIREPENFDISPETLAALKDRGNLYTVRLHAKPSEMIDWDAPVAEQPSLQAIIDGNPEFEKALKYSNSHGGKGATGAQFYAGLGGTQPGERDMRAPTASEKLRAAGIKGIRYLDSGSRLVPGQVSINRRIIADAQRRLATDPEDAKAAKELAQAQTDLDKWERENQTRNIVVFHHGDVEITHRNGVPTHPIYNRDQTLSPEAEEHEFRQGQDAEDAQQRGIGFQEPEPAGAHPGNVQSGGGQVPDATGDARRSGAQEGEGGKQAPDLTTAHGGPWSEIGKNHQGDTVYENPNGIRATMENGVPWMEATKEHPDRGRVPHDEGKRSERVQVVEAPAATEKPAEEIGQNPQTSATSSAETASEEITPTTEPQAPAKPRAPRQKREPEPYETVPKAPKRLIQFLREPTVINRGTIHQQTIPGGVRDVGGDVKAAIGGARGRPGLINNTAGRHLDDATLRAWEAGYFPEHDQRPEINDLLNAIRDDHEGRPRYSVHDQEAIDAHHDALGQNSEIDRLAAQHDIPTRGLTRDQFFDHLAERLEEQSLEDEARYHAEMDASLAADVDNLDREAKQWNSVGAYGNDQPRTLEDLEHEYRQEGAAGESGEGGPDHDGRGRAASFENAGEEGARQDGRDARSSGRDDAPGQASEGDRNRVDPGIPNAHDRPAVTVRPDQRFAGLHQRGDRGTGTGQPSDAAGGGDGDRQPAGERADARKSADAGGGEPGFEEGGKPQGPDQPLKSAQLEGLDLGFDGEPKSEMEPTSSITPTKIGEREQMEISAMRPGRVRDAVDMVVNEIQSVGFRLTKVSRSGKSDSTYLRFEREDGEPITVTKSGRATYFQKTGDRIPGTPAGGFNVRVSDHHNYGDGPTEVHASIRVDRDAEKAIAAAVNKARVLAEVQKPAGDQNKGRD